MTTQITVAASIATPTTTGVDGALDVSFTLETTDGVVSIEGEVTLVRNEQTGRFGAWGSPDHWLDGAALQALRALGLSDDEFTTALGEIETACAAECES